MAAGLSWFLPYPLHARCSKSHAKPLCKHRSLPLLRSPFTNGYFTTLRFHHCLHSQSARKHIFVVDPLGNLILRFPEDADPKLMIKDMIAYLENQLIPDLDA